MIILVWVCCILILSIIIGEFRFRHLISIKNKSNKDFTYEQWFDSIDKDIDVLDIESSGIDFVSTTRLAMRGSWRLAQDSVMTMADFIKQKDDEYAKKLQ